MFYSSEKIASALSRHSEETYHVFWRHPGIHPEEQRDFLTMFHIFQFFSISKLFWMSCWIMLLVSDGALAVPVRSKRQTYGAIDNLDLNIERDIRLLTKRNAIADHSDLWFLRVVPYRIDNSISASISSSISAAIQDLQTLSCLRFKPHENEPDFINFRFNEQATSCDSHIGRKGGIQSISLAPKCDSKGGILHELMHSLGFYHEHNRPDRDDYVTINWENINPDDANNFRILPISDVTTLNLPYDFGSIMHYPKNAYAIDPEQATIIPKVPSEATEMGQRLQLSAIDVEKLNNLYRCNIQSCEEPGIPKHGSILNKGESSVGESVNYVCDDGFTLIGSYERYCTDSGSWTGQVPHCLADISFYCNFESEKICGWTVDLMEPWDWHNGKTPSDNTGPKSDHTLQAPSGHYMYFETSSPVQTGDQARLASLSLPPSNTASTCLRFSYHMYGKTMGSLRVYLISEGGSESELKMIEGDQGNAWHDTTLPISVTGDFQLDFVAQKGAGSYSDIAIDDVIIGDCGSLGVPDVVASKRSAKDCDSSHNSQLSECSWKNRKKYNEADWNWIEDAVPKDSPLCRSNPGLCSSNGEIHAAVFLPRKQTATGSIESITYPPGVQPQKCISFKYWIIGHSVNELRLLANRDSNIIWSTHGKNIVERSVQVDFDTNAPFRLLFQATTGSDPDSAIIVDDLRIQGGSCQNSQTRSRDNVECNFDSGFCGWKSSGKWKLSSETAELALPMGDSTGKGYYAYPKPGNNQEWLSSPVIRNGHEGYCIQFEYFMYGDDDCKLVFGIDHLDGHAEKVWETSKDDDSRWKHAQIFVQPRSSFKVIVKAVGNPANTYSRMAIDELKVRSGLCKNGDLAGRH